MNHSCLSFQYNSIREFQSLRRTLSVLLVITSLAAVSLNSLILYSIWKNPSLHKPSYLLLSNLALSDLLFGALAETSLILGHHAYLNKWTTKYCYIAATAHLFGHWLGSMSMYCLALISIDRLLAIRLKKRYRSFVTSRRIWMVTVPYWVGMFLLLLILLLRNVFRQYAIKVVGPSVLFVFLATIAVCYSMAFYSLKKLTSSVSSSSQQPPDNGTNTFDVSQYRRSMNTMILVMLTTMLLYLPQLCAAATFSIMDEQGFYSILAHKFLRSTDVIVALSPVVNPLLYLCRMQDIRQAVKTTVRRILRRDHYSFNSE